MQQVSDGQLLSVEMQSGDVLEVCCKEVLVRSAENERYDEPKPLRGLRP
jgi:hypothetical protein